RAARPEPAGRRAPRGSRFNPRGVSAGTCRRAVGRGRSADDPRDDRARRDGFRAQVVDAGDLDPGAAADPRARRLPAGVRARERRWTHARGHGTRRPRGAHAHALAAPDRGAALRDPRSAQQADRAHPRPLREHGEGASLRSAAHARRAQPHRGGLRGGEARAARRLTATAAQLSAGIARTESTPSIADNAATTPSSTGLSTSTSVYAISPRDLLTMLWMLSPARAIVVEICPSMFGTFAFAIATRYGDSRGMSTFGKLTAFWTVPCSRNSRTWSTTITAQFSSASSVEAPRCGKATTPGSPSSAGPGKSVT